MSKSQRSNGSNNGWSKCDVCRVGTKEHIKCDVCGILLGTNHFGGLGRTLAKEGTLCLIDEYGIWDDWRNYLVKIDTDRVPLIVCEDCFEHTKRRSNYRKDILEKRIKF